MDDMVHSINIKLLVFAIKSYIFDLLIVIKYLFINSTSVTALSCWLDHSGSYIRCHSLSSNALSFAFNMEVSPLTMHVWRWQWFVVEQCTEMRNVTELEVTRSADTANMGLGGSKDDPWPHEVIFDLSGERGRTWGTVDAKWETVE